MEAVEANRVWYEFPNLFAWIFHLAHPLCLSPLCLTPGLPQLVCLTPFAPASCLNRVASRSVCLTQSAPLGLTGRKHWPIERVSGNRIPIECHCNQAWASNGTCVFGLALELNLDPDSQRRGTGLAQEPLDNPTRAPLGPHGPTGNPREPHTVDAWDPTGTPNPRKPYGSPWPHGGLIVATQAVHGSGMGPPR